MEEKVLQVVGTQMTMGAIKNAQAHRKAAKAFEGAITEVHPKAMSSEALMRYYLNEEFNHNDAGQLYAELEAQGYVVSNEINYRACGDLNGIQLSKPLVDYKDKGALVKLCNKIGEKLTIHRDYSVLQNSYIALVGELKTSIQEKEILGAITGPLAGAAAQKVVPFI